MLQPAPGIEPGIFGFVDQRLIHWATRAGVDASATFLPTYNPGLDVPGYRSNSICLTLRLDSKEMSKACHLPVTGVNTSAAATVRRRPGLATSSQPLAATCCRTIHGASACHPCQPDGASLWIQVRGKTQCASVVARCRLCHCQVTRCPDCLQGCCLRQHKARPQSTSAAVATLHCTLPQDYAAYTADAFSHYQLNGRLYLDQRTTGSKAFPCMMLTSPNEACILCRPPAGGAGAFGAPANAQPLGNAGGFGKGFGQPAAARPVFGGRTRSVVPTSGMHTGSSLPSENYTLCLQPLSLGLLG